MLITEEKTKETAPTQGRSPDQSVGEEKTDENELPLPQVDSEIKEMYLNGMHLGYSQTSRNPKMKPYIFGLRNGVEIFDLEKTKKNIDSAKEFAKKLGKDKKVILFVGTKKEAKDLIENTANELGMPFVKERWIGGTLTNFKQIKGRIDHLNDLKKKRDEGELDKYTKKEKLQIERQIKKMETYFGGLADNLKFLPSAILAVDSKHEKISVNEASQMKIPVVALLNSDCNPSDINYPVPGNDNSRTSISYFLGEFAKAYKEGTLLAQQEEAKQEEIKKEVKAETPA